LIDATKNIDFDVVKKGTTTIGIICRDSVVLATDTRVTMGYFVAHKKGKKIYKIDDHLAITIAGAAGGIAIYIIEAKKHKRFEVRPKKTTPNKIIGSEIIRNQAKNKLKSYISETMIKGFTEPQLRDNLKKIGWPDSMVDEVFKELKKW